MPVPATLYLKNQFGDLFNNYILGGTAAAIVSPIAAKTLLGNSGSSSAVAAAINIADLQTLLVLSSFVSGAGTVSSADTLIGAVNKIVGNIQNKTVLANVLSTFVSGAGTVSASDTVVSAFNKLVGNTQNLAVINNVLTGYSVGANTPVANTDTILQAIAKLQGQVSAII